MVYLSAVHRTFIWTHSHVRVHFSRCISLFAILFPSHSSFASLHWKYICINVNEHMLVFMIITSHPLWHWSDATQLIIFDLPRSNWTGKKCRLQFDWIDVLSAEVRWVIFQQHIICYAVMFVAFSIGFIRLFIFRSRHIDTNVLPVNTVDQENDVISFNYVLKGAFIRGKVNTTTNKMLGKWKTITHYDRLWCGCVRAVLCCLVVDTRHDCMLLFSLLVIVCVCVCLCLQLFLLR